MQKWVPNTCLHKELPKHMPVLIIKEFPRIFSPSWQTDHKVIPRSNRMYIHAYECSNSTRWHPIQQSRDFKMHCIIDGDKGGSVTTQPRLGTAASPWQVVSCSQPRRRSCSCMARPARAAACSAHLSPRREKHFSHTPEMRVTSPHREPRAFKATVKSMSWGAKCLWLFPKNGYLSVEAKARSGCQRHGSLHLANAATYIYVCPDGIWRQQRARSQRKHNIHFICWRLRALRAE